MGHSASNVLGLNTVDRVDSSDYTLNRPVHCIVGNEKKSLLKPLRNNNCVSAVSFRKRVQIIQIIQIAMVAK